MPDVDTQLDWRAYANEQGITPMHAWIACQKAFSSRYPHGHIVASPKSLDQLAADPDMHDAIRTAIDDAR